MPTGHHGLCGICVLVGSLARECGHRQGQRDDTQCKDWGSLSAVGHGFSRVIQICEASGNRLNGFRFNQTLLRPGWSQMWMKSSTLLSSIYFWSKSIDRCSL